MGLVVLAGQEVSQLVAQEFALVGETFELLGGLLPATDRLQVLFSQCRKLALQFLVLRGGHTRCFRQGLLRLGTLQFDAVCGGPVCALGLWGRRSSRLSGQSAAIELAVGGKFREMLCCWCYEVGLRGGHRG